MIIRIFQDSSLSETTIFGHRALTTDARISLTNQKASNPTAIIRSPSRDFPSSPKVLQPTKPIVMALTPIFAHLLLLLPAGEPEEKIDHDAPGVDGHHNSTTQRLHDRFVPRWFTRSPLLFCAALGSPRCSSLLRLGMPTPPDTASLA